MSDRTESGDEPGHEGVLDPDTQQALDELRRLAASNALDAPGQIVVRPTGTDTGDAPRAGLDTIAMSGRDGAGPRRRAARSATPPLSWWWRYGFPGLLAVLVLVVPLLLYVGQRIVLESADTQSLITDKQPDEPGWEALANPTPTLLVGVTDDAGELISIAVLALSSPEASSSVLIVHPDTVAPVPGTEENTVPGIAYLEGGAEGLADVVGAMLNAAMEDVVVISPEQLALLVAPMGALRVDNIDPVDDGVVSFPRGPIDLAPEEVAAFLGVRTAAVDDINRMERHVAFWRAWVDAIAASDLEAPVPGESDSGLGLMLRDMTATEVSVRQLPVEAVSVPGGGVTDRVYVPIHPRTELLVTQLIPFPVGSPPGARIRIRLLDGTGQLNHGLPATPLLVFQGGEITSFGNAVSFDVTVTQVIYYDDALAPAAESMRDALGVGEVAKSEARGESVDLTIVLGSDWAALPIAQQQLPLTEGTVRIVESGGGSTSGGDGG